MILDKQAELTTATGFDLGVVQPGTGQPICLSANGVTAGIGGIMSITHGTTAALAEAAATELTRVNVTEDVAFTLPSNCLRFIACTFTAGTVNVVLDSQTAT